MAGLGFPEVFFAEKVRKTKANIKQKCLMLETHIVPYCVDVPSFRAAFGACREMRAAASGKEGGGGSVLRVLCVYVCVCVCAEWWKFEFLQ